MRLLRVLFVCGPGRKKRPRVFMTILIVMEVFLVLITAGTGVVEGVLQIASESLGGFMRS